MGEIKLCDIEEAKSSALKFLKDVDSVDSEYHFCFIVVVLLQLINCLLYKVVNDTAKLCFRDIQGLSKSNELRRLFKLRNTICHLYGTEQYRKALEEVRDVFNGDLYSEVLLFIKDVVASVEDGTFMSKYGVPQKKMPNLNFLLNRG